MTNKNIVLEFIEKIWNQRRFEELDKYIGPQYTIHSDPGDPWEGQTLNAAIFKERVNSSLAVFPDFHFTILEAIAEGEKVVLYWRLRGAHTGDMPHLKATRKRIDVPGLTIYYLSKGKIVGHSQLVDRFGFLQQIGSVA